MALKKPKTTREEPQKKPIDLGDPAGNIQSTHSSAKTKVNFLKGRIAKADLKAKSLLEQERLERAPERISLRDSFDPSTRMNNARVHFEETLTTIAEEAASPAGTKTTDRRSLPLGASSELRIDHFEIGGPLGRGKFGQVFLARHRPTNYICALKYLSKVHVSGEKEERLVRRELEIHQNVTHPNILHFLSWFHDEKNVYLVLEYACGGNLFHHLRKQPNFRFTENVAAEYVAQMAEALLYLHTKNIMHRDIKPENILLGLHGEIKLADFGYSIHSVSGLRSTVVGTLDYLSPEVAMMLINPGKKHEFYTKAIDQWSVGVLAFELLTGKPPFEMKSRKATEKKIAYFKNKVRFPGHVSKTAEEFVMGVSRLRSPGGMIGN
ncbi:kinase-like domain-containing protein [Clohesyomyces aquaticus]|uniref:Aurora kinase n=1 Tax=Clohesyomyces aquaticus TaxID=1231657 RepID=A0A1Y1ZGH7_9PLEO|nr:kinase-like domain-containing protein [Clohesyomyces aquaticus]